MPSTIPKILIFSVFLEFFLLSAFASAERPELPDITVEEFRRYLVKPAPPERMPEPEKSKATVLLREEPQTLSEEDIKSMLKKYNFFDSLRNKSGDFKNDFKNNGDGTVTDRVTGLMWQKSGSEKSMEYEKALAYINELNREGFAGHKDWRLPTIEELASLLESREMNGDLYIDPVFDRKQGWCWSADKRSSGSAWSVGFYDGLVLWFSIDYDYYVRAVRSCW